MQFNVNDYETVKERKAKFYADYPDGRIVVTLLNTDIEKKALFLATIYKTKDEQEKNLPFATGNALEIRDETISVSSSGKEYESVNFSSWTENAEESAIGRALDNAGYSGNKKCSREEMQKAQRMTETLKKAKGEAVQKPSDDILGFPKTSVSVKQAWAKAYKVADAQDVPSVKMADLIHSFFSKNGDVTAEVIDLAANAVFSNGYEAVLKAAREKYMARKNAEVQQVVKSVANVELVADSEIDEVLEAMGQK